MSKRLLRIPQIKIVSSSEKLVNQAANIILNNGAVSNGYIIAVETNGVILKDKRSMKLRFALTDINEIILDLPA